MIHETPDDLVQTARADDRMTEDSKDDLPNGGLQIWFEAANEEVAAEYHNDAEIETNQMGIGSDEMDGAMVAIVVESPDGEYNHEAEPGRHPAESEADRQREEYLDNAGHRVNNYRI